MANTTPDTAAALSSPAAASAAVPAACVEAPVPTPLATGPLIRIASKIARPALSPIVPLNAHAAAAKLGSTFKVAAMCTASPVVVHLGIG